MPYEYHSVEEASVHAEEFCVKHPGWKRICDIENSDALYKTWRELSKEEQWPWIQTYRDGAERAWSAFGRRPCRVPFGYVSGKGVFYHDIMDVPRFHNLMMVFQLPPAPDPAAFDPGQRATGWQGGDEYEA